MSESKNTYIQEPFDPSTIDVERKSMSLSTIITMLGNDFFDLSPAFQRKGELWDIKKQSQLIESILLKLPLPSFYLEFDSVNGKYVVIDGLQRLCSLKNFAVDGTLTLTGLEFLDTTHGDKHYSDLTLREQIDFGMQEVTVNLLRGTTPPSAKFIIFKRLNSGGMNLENQEIRNALYQGPGNDLLKRMASYALFKTIGFKSVRLKDQEVCLRFCAFLKRGYDEYGRMEPFLTDTLAGNSKRFVKGLNEMTAASLDGIYDTFVKSINRCVALLGAEAFCLPGKKKAPSSSFFDALTINVAAIDDTSWESVLRHKDDFKKSLDELLKEDRQFRDSVSSKSDRKVSTKYRHETLANLLSQFI